MAPPKISQAKKTKCEKWFQFTHLESLASTQGGQERRPRGLLEAAYLRLRSRREQAHVSSGQHTRHLNSATCDTAWRTGDSNIGSAQDILVKRMGTIVVGVHLTARTRMSQAPSMLITFSPATCNAAWRDRGQRTYRFGGRIYNLEWACSCVVARWCTYY